MLIFFLMFRFFLHAMQDPKLILIISIDLSGNCIRYYIKTTLDPRGGGDKGLSFTNNTQFKNQTGI